MSFWDSLVSLYYESFNDSHSDYVMMDFFNFSDIKRCLNEYKNFDSEQLQQKAANVYLTYFHFVADRVPAYNDFLFSQGISHYDIKTTADFNEIPWVDKNNYLRRYRLNELCVDGKIQSNVTASISSGSSGIPFAWPRGTYQNVESYFTTELYLTNIFEINKYKTLVVNCFSMGMYVAGTFISDTIIRVAAKGYDALVVSPGLNQGDIETVIVDLSKSYDQIIIAGYPPLIKDTVDAMNLKGFDWKEKKVRFLFATEGFSETWRNNIIASVGQDPEDYKVSLNIYGSADSLILGHETPISIYVKKLIEKGDVFSNAVIGSCRRCTFVQYNPLLRYFQKTNKEILFSSFAGIPLIRYNIHDEGGIITHSALQKKINTLGTDFSADLTIKGLDDNNWRLPFVYLFGKSNNVISFYGLKIYPENIQASLESDKLKKYVSGRFQMRAKENLAGYREFHLDIELGLNVIPDTQIEVLIETEVVRVLKNKNAEYNCLNQALGEKSLPAFMFFQKGTGVFSMTSVKHVWAISS